MENQSNQFIVNIKMESQPIIVISIAVSVIIVIYLILRFRKSITFKHTNAKSTELNVSK
jgi:predicted ABC-type sugar transport system permease subunit